MKLKMHSSIAHGFGKRSKKHQLLKDDSFYDRIDHSSEYDNEINNSSAAAAGATLTPEEQEKEQEELRKELAKLEEEITTLRSVLSTKQKEAANIKAKLGITPMTEMKADLRTGLNNIKESDTVKKTGEALNKIEESITTSQAYQKTNTALKSFGQWSSKKLGDVRNSNTFKSFEERVGGAYSSVRNKLVSSPSAEAVSDTDKSRMTGSQSEDNFDEALRAHQQRENNASGDAASATTPTM